MVLSNTYRKVYINVVTCWGQRIPNVREMDGINSIFSTDLRSFGDDGDLFNQWFWVRINEIASEVYRIENQGVSVEYITINNFALDSIVFYPDYNNKSEISNLSSIFKFLVEKGDLYIRVECRINDLRYYKEE